MIYCSNLVGIQGNGGESHVGAGICTRMSGYLPHCDLGRSAWRQGVQGIYNLVSRPYLDVDIRNTYELAFENIQDFFGNGFYRVFHPDYVSQCCTVIFCHLLVRGVSPQELYLLLLVLT